MAVGGQSLDDLLDALGRSAVYDLEQPRFTGAPIHPVHAPGYLYSLHRRHEAGLGEARTSASGLIVAAEHSGTHIDALCHQAEHLCLFGGRSVDARVQTPVGFTELGIETVPPLLCRGVLVDLAQAAGVHALPLGHVVGAAELARAAAEHDLPIREGDAVLLRTGNAARWDDPESYLAGPGLGREAAEWLAHRRPVLVGCDNVALDVLGHIDPELGTSLPCHVVLLVRNGIYILENLCLDELAAHGVRTFAFVCLPLKLRGATGSPVRPLAIVPAGV
jgi:kynurenine formamidase